MIKEFCAENCQFIEKAIIKGANRIELCDNLAVGGTTVSVGNLQRAYEISQATNVQIMSIIRPRAGNFVYDKFDKQIIFVDAKTISSFKFGLVFGCLDKNNHLDKSLIDEFVNKFPNVIKTFHMAFDELSIEEQFLAIDFLKDKFDNILTHGGKSGTNIEDNIQHLQDLANYAKDKIKILVGGGVNFQNLISLQEKLPFCDFHGTKIVDLF